MENDTKVKILKKYRNVCDNEYLDGIPTLIQNFLAKYLFIKEFALITINQPISFETNLTLFYNYIIYSLYYYTIEIDKVNNYIFFKKEKLLIYYTLSKYHNLIFDNCFDENLSIDKTIVLLLKLLILSLSYNKVTKSFEYIYKYIHLERVKTEKFLNSETAKELIEIINNKYLSLKDRVIDDKIVLTDKILS